MDLSDALLFLDRQSAKSHGPHVVEELSDHKSTAIYVGNGDVVRHSHALPDRRHTVNNLNSLAGAIKRFGSDATVWVSLTEVVAVLNDGAGSYRADVVRMPAEPSHVFEAIRKFPNVQPIGGSIVKGILRHLRVEVRPAIITPENFETSLSNVKMETYDVDETQHTKTKDNISRSVRAEVTGTNELTDTVGFKFAPYPALLSEVAESVTVGCSVVVDALNRSIVIKALPGELQLAEVRATQFLEQAVREATEDSVAVLCGKP